MANNVNSRAASLTVEKCVWMSNMNGWGARELHDLSRLELMCASNLWICQSQERLSSLYRLVQQKGALTPRKPTHLLPATFPTACIFYQTPI